MFMVALQKLPHIQVIDHKFLVPGHTYMECDSDHSVIESLKKNPVWISIILVTGSN